MAVRGLECGSVVSLPVSSVALHPMGATLSPGLERAAALSAPAELCNPENDTLAALNFSMKKGASQLSTIFLSLSFLQTASKLEDEIPGRNA